MVPAIGGQGTPLSLSASLDNSFSLEKAGPFGSLGEFFEEKFLKARHWQVCLPCQIIAAYDDADSLECSH